ncbi:hypothetical protein ACWEQL_08410 [Kitasatospora sp. NPDC004240]
MTRTTRAQRAEWQRLRDHIAQTRAERHGPDHDIVLQHAPRVERHRHDVADRARSRPPGAVTAEP